MKRHLLRAPGRRVAAVVAGLAVLLGPATPAWAGPPNHPGDPVVTAVTDTTVSLTWAAAPHPAEVRHYRIVKNGGTPVGTTRDTSFTVTRLVPNRKYSFAVEAINHDGGGWSSNHMPVRTTGETPSTPAEPVVTGLFPEKDSHERGFHVKDLVTGGSAAKLTHLTYGHGTVSGGRCGIADRNAALERAFTAGDSVFGRADTAQQPLRGHLNQLRGLKDRYPDLKLLWSFRGTGPADWAAARQDPAAFAASCARLLDDPRWAGLFDGIDLSLDIRLCYSSQNGCYEDSSAAVTALTRELRSTLGADRLLTATIRRASVGKGTYARDDLVSAAAHVNWYNVEAYDYFHPQSDRWAHVTAPHAPLVSWDVWDCCQDVQHDVWNLTERGIHPNKLVLGIPTHAWGWRGLVAKPWPNEYTARGPADGAYGPGLDDYRTISTRCAPTGQMGRTAIAVCGDQYWTYDTPTTIAGKVAYLKENGMGGAFLSNLRGDTARGDLLTALTSALAR
ncbi:glycosyl hydrolase family 18 protein [Streptomyces sp. LE64]|uniref:glycosyl hydrolase family 18 protein n=1 Tax=Streptomyces sp. LE64 TaxID=3448653 RepID=UPI00404260B3